MNSIFFDSWQSVIRTSVITVLAYILLILLLRIFGKRTLSKMNAFDLIVTVALGSILATVALSKDVPLVNGVLAFFILIALQFVITYASVRSQKISDLVKGTPTLLLYKGAMLRNSMQQERITEEEIYATVRAHGFDTIKNVGAVVLETDGTLTVINSLDDMPSDTMANLK